MFLNLLKWINKLSTTVFLAYSQNSFFQINWSWHYRGVEIHQHLTRGENNSLIKLKIEQLRNVRRQHFEIFWYRKYFAYANPTCIVYCQALMILGGAGLSVSLSCSIIAVCVYDVKWFQGFFLYVCIINAQLKYTVQLLNGPSGE